MFHEILDIPSCNTTIAVDHRATINTVLNLVISDLDLYMSNKIKFARRFLKTWVTNCFYPLVLVLVVVVVVVQYTYEMYFYYYYYYHYNVCMYLGTLYLLPMQ